MSLGPVADLFRNVRMETLAHDRDAGMIIRTVLTYGSWEQIEWLFKSYGWHQVAAIVRADIDGMRTLPDSVRAFWTIVFQPGWARHADPPAQERWRQSRQVPDLFEARGPQTRGT